MIRSQILESEELSEELLEKLKKLEDYIEGLGSLAVGFSGGVDSTLLLYVAHNVLGDKVIAVTGADASVPEREVNEAEAFCNERGIRQIICRVDPLKEEGYRHNGPDRCYFCKHGIFTEVKKRLLPFLDVIMVLWLCIFQKNPYLFRNTC